MVYSWKGCSFSERYGGVRNSDGKIQKEAKFLFTRKRIWERSGGKEVMRKGCLLREFKCNESFASS